MAIRSVNRMSVLLLVASLATACAGGGGARDFGGPWTPLNQYAASSEAIALAPAQVFQATPMDGTLRSLLARWARDAGSRLDYRHPYDFSLHQAVQHVHAHSLTEAIAQLGEAFGGQGVLIRAEEGALVVVHDPGGKS